MGILKFHRSWTDPALADLSLVDRSLGSFLGEKCFRNDFQSVPKQLRLEIGIPSDDTNTFRENIKEIQFNPHLDYHFHRKSK